MNAKKSFLMVYVVTNGCYENTKMKLWSIIAYQNYDTVEFFYYKQKMIVKFNYVL